jgi:hypothetical protein
MCHEVCGAEKHLAFRLDTGHGATNIKEETMKKALQIGGIAAGLVLIGFGTAATVLGIKGGDT